MKQIELFDKTIDVSLLANKINESRSKDEGLGRLHCLLTLYTTTCK